MPNLFPKDELAGGLDEGRPAAKKAGAGETSEALYAFFLENVRTNLHVILCLSPIGEAFRERCRMFPGNMLLQVPCLWDHHYASTELLCSCLATAQHLVKQPSLARKVM